LTQLYDVEKVFNSTLEMDELNPIITAKVREHLEAQAVNLWLVKDEQELLLMEPGGRGPHPRSGSSERTGEGYVAAVSDSGEPLIIEDAGDERLQRRKCRPGRRDLFGHGGSPGGQGLRGRRHRSH
jgi:signal transduction protein with GAF and PtsI domain